MPHYRAPRSLGFTPLDAVIARVDPRTAATSLRVGAVMFATALTGLSAVFSVAVPGTAVPFTMQPAAVLLVGAVLGARLGALSQALYLCLGVVGASMFALSPQLLPGAARLLGPTGGFLLAFPLAAGVTGWLADRGWSRTITGSVPAMFVGLAVLYVGGAAWLAVAVPELGGIGGALATLTPFIGPDIVKVCVASVAVPLASKALGRRA